jgi:hypothetical protein
MCELKSAAFDTDTTTRSIVGFGLRMIKRTATHSIRTDLRQPVGHAVPRSRRGAAWRGAKIIGLAVSVTVALAACGSHMSGLGSGQYGNSNPQSELVNARTVVQAEAEGDLNSDPNGDRYPASTGTPLPSAFSFDSDAASLGLVYYSDTARSRTVDTYDLWAWDQADQTVYELSVVNGWTRYGTERNVSQNPADTNPAAHTTNWSTQSDQNGW